MDAIMNIIQTSAGIMWIVIICIAGGLVSERVSNKIMEKAENKSKAARMVINIIVALVFSPVILTAVLIVLKIFW